MPPILDLFIERPGGFAMSRITLTAPRRKLRTRDPEYYDKMALCRLCLIPFPPDQLPHKLTMKMLIQTEKQLRVNSHSRTV